MQRKRVNACMDTHTTVTHTHTHTHTIFTHAYTIQNMYTHTHTHTHTHTRICIPPSQACVALNAQLFAVPLAEMLIALDSLAA